MRAWTRNVRFAGDATLSSTDRIVLASNPTGIVTLDPTGDNIRWRYAAPAGCRFLDAAAGSAGVAVLQRCAGATVGQLRLFDGFTGEPHWSRDVPLTGGAEPRLLGADPLTDVLVDGEVQALAAADGTVLRPAARVRPDVHGGRRPAGAPPCVRVDGTADRARRRTGRTRWEVPALGLPARAGRGQGRPRHAGAAGAGGRRLRAARPPATGAELGRSAADDLPDGGPGGGVGPDVVFRLPDRVLAYR